jgi:ABC-type uncharacterized transport system permease subunit
MVAAGYIAGLVTWFVNHKERNANLFADILMSNEDVFHSAGFRV